MTVRSIVSENRCRYVDRKAAVDLDLSYVTDRIIAMSYPSEGWEGLYRNPLKEVKKFLDERHGPANYKVYNLRSEKQYQEETFSFSAATYAFEDHQAPPFDLLVHFCKDAGDWLKEPNHVVAIHCKAGKGRTGTAIAALLLYTHQASTADEAMTIYSSKRTKDGRGITIPSQMRYVRYFGRWLHCAKKHSNRSSAISIYKIILHGIPTVYKRHPEYWVDFTISSFDGLAYEKDHTSCTMSVDDQTISMEIPYVRVENDFKLEFYVRSLYLFKRKICRLWLNTHFIVPDDTTTVKTMRLSKAEIDGAANDTQHTQFPQDFAIEIEFSINID